jgi:SAM-dependent methyltransferase
MSDKRCDDCGTSWVCGACGSTRVESVVCLGDQPLANGLLDTPGQIPVRYPLHMVACTACLAVQLTRQVPPAVMFGAYPYFSSQSATMVDSARTLARRLTGDLALGTRDTVLEVGSNDGYLLRWYAEAGIRTVGVDPARECATVAATHGIETVVDYFGPYHADTHAGTAAAVHANNVLAHVPDPSAVLAGIRRVLRPDGLLVVETPWLVPMVGKAQFDVVYHEHRWYWSLTAFRRVCAQVGLNIVDVEYLPLHGGSLRIFAAPDRHRTPRPAVARIGAAEIDARLDSVVGLVDFGARVEGRIRGLRAWRDRLGSPTVGYGAAAKGTMMLAQTGPVDWVVDSTPAKIGRYLPVGGGVPIRDPETLTDEMPPDCVLLAWNFAAEIADKARSYIDRGGRLWTTTPAPALIGARDAIPA